MVVASSTPASADQISDAQAQASAVTAKLNAAEAQIQTLAGQVNEADYKLSQLQGQIAANQAQVAKDRDQVAKDQGQLQVQAISDYTNSGTSNTATQIFTSNVNTSGIRSEYSSIATGNVTSTIDRLHTAQATLAASQATLEQQKTQAQATRDSLASAQSQADALASQDKATLASVDANIQQLVQQRQAAAGRGRRRRRTGRVQPEGRGVQGGPGPTDPSDHVHRFEQQLGRGLVGRRLHGQHAVRSPAAAVGGRRRSRPGRRA